jgi:23S rRNA pseudouridine2605 synthase
LNAHFFLAFKKTKHSCILPAFSSNKENAKKKSYNKINLKLAYLCRKFLRMNDKRKRPERTNNTRKKYSNDSASKNRGKKPEKPKNAKFVKSENKETFNSFDDDKPMRLNKFIANSGICSRREADRLIEAGAIKVNGQVVSEMGSKVNRNDQVLYGDQKLSFEKHVYLLLNKPKDFITTTDDPQERKTVMDLIKNACKERVYPIGRLDKNTTGLLLFTNNGDLAKKLIHPKHNIKKVYHVVLDKILTKNDMIKIIDGFELDDGLIAVDKIAYSNPDHDKREIGIEIHSGKNRIIRRIFEHLDYKVVKLDRVMFAGLTKLDLPRGKWRLLEQKEISFLKKIG